MELFQNIKKDWIETDKIVSKEDGLPKPRFEVLAEFHGCEIEELKIAGPEEFAIGIDMSEPKNLDECSKYADLFDEYLAKLANTAEIEHELEGYIGFKHVKVYYMEGMMQVYVYESGYESVITK